MAKPASGPLCTSVVLFACLAHACNSTPGAEGGSESDSSALVTESQPPVEPECGNGIVEDGEACDDGNHSNEDDCVEGCVEASCGDGYRHEALEACDDGNDVDEDGCSNSCEVNYHPLCGDPEVPTLGAQWRYLDDEAQDPSMPHCDQDGAANQPEDWVGPGWYQLGPSFNHFIPGDPPGDPLDCGAPTAGWVVTPYPAAEEGAVSAQLCFATANDECAEMIAIQLVNCGYDPGLAWLADVPSCDTSYCLDEIPVP